MASVQKYDLYSQEFSRHSHQVFARMRQDDPVIQQMGMIGEVMIWYVTRYAEVEQVLLNDMLFVRDPRLALTPEEAAKFMLNGDVHIDAMLNNHMLNKEGDDHRRLRSLVSKAFTPKVIQALRPRIQQIADELLDQVQGRGQMELVGEFAYPLPITVIAELLGLPVEDRAKFRSWANAVVSFPLTPEQQQETLLRLGELAAYMLNLVAERRQHPGSDLLSGLIHAEEQGDRLSESELFSMLNLLIVAGHETTVTLIGNAVLALLRHPDQLDLLKQDPSLIGSAVEELLRYDAPVERALTRWATRDTQLAGKQLRRGDLVIVILGSANRDEARFSQPDELNLRRQANPHLAFGKGAHYCLGAPLARLEGEIAIATLLRRLPGLKLDITEDDLRWRNVLLFHSLECLPLRWQV